MINDFQKQIALGLIFVALLAVSVIFREKISNFLNFGESPGSPIANTPSREPEVTLGEEAPTSQKPPAEKVTPAYTGRDPEELRPVPEEVKLFTETQKQQLYATLLTHARAVKADPGYFTGWIQLGLLKKTIGDFEGARDAWEYAGIIQPKNSLSFANLGELYWRYLHQYSESEKNLKISLAHKPDDFQTYITLAELYHYSLTAKADLADDVLLDGLKAMPGDQTLMRRLAYLYEQRKEYSLAIQWWEKVLEINPDDQDVIGTISRLRNKLSS